MNKKLGLALLAVLIALPMVTFAYTDCRDIDKPDACSVEQLVQISNQTHLTMEDRISALKMALKMLTGKLATLINPTTSCLDLQNDLWIGKTDAATNGEVTKLQKFLAMQATGYYGALTAEAVVKWQKAHGMDFVTLKSGVGPMTRAKMKCI